MLEMMMNWKLVPFFPKWTSTTQTYSYYGGAGAIIGDDYYVCGGYRSAATNTLLKFKLGTNNPPVTLATIPEATVYHQMTAVGTKLYVYGGWVGEFVSSKKLRIYDTVNNTWTDGPPGPFICRQGASFVIGTKIYYMSTESVDITFFSYDTVTGTWATVATLTGYKSPGLEPRTVYLDGYVYIFPGSVERDKLIRWKMSDSSVKVITGAVDWRIAGVPFVWEGDIYYWSGAKPPPAYNGTAGLTKVTVKAETIEDISASKMTTGDPAQVAKSYASQAYSDNWIAACGSYNNPPYFIYAKMN